MLSKKLRGASFETDVKNLKEIGGFSEQDASDYAYLFAEAVVCDTFVKLMKLSGNEDNADEYIKEISVEMSVDDTTKITVK
ncbi:MAG: hypothetical protein HFE79_12385 [Ruminiclostridium sp.]|jgi:hypothetical protein|nr:hypothetical protein [Ruminiclostridium sp.]